MHMLTERNKYRVKSVIRDFMASQNLSCRVLAEHLQDPSLPERKIASHISLSGPLPNAHHIQVYADFFGPAFLQAWLSSQGFHISSVRAAPKDMHGFLTDGLRFFYRYSEIVEDDRIDHQEEAEIVPLLLTKGTEFTSYGLWLKEGRKAA